MITYACYCIEQYLEHLENIDLQYTQLKSGNFCNEIIVLPINDIRIHYVKSNLSAEFLWSVPDYYTFMFVTSKSKQFCNNIELEEDSIIIIEPKKEMQRIGHGDYESSTVLIPKTTIENKFGNLKSSVYKVTNKDLLLQLTFNLFKMVNANIINDILKDYYLKNILKNVLVNIEAIVNNLESYKELNAYQKKFIEISEFMQVNYKSDLSVIEIANNFKISERTMRNIFSNQMGISPKQFKHAIQMNKFKDKLLKSTKDNITDIIIECGMRDHSLCSKNFKEFFKMTPSEYKNRHLRK